MVVAVIAVEAFYYRSSTRASINSVAVLPFSNTSGDPNSEYISDGITEGVIDRLSGLLNLKVISRTSAFHYKQRDIDPEKVAGKLGVQALVTGRVVQHGDDLSVSAELVDAREDKQLWGEQYSRKLADIHSVQQDIATAVSGSLRVRLTGEDKTRFNKRSPPNSEAYQLFHQLPHPAQRMIAWYPFFQRHVTEHSRLQLLIVSSHPCFLSRIRSGLAVVLTTS